MKTLALLLIAALLLMGMAACPRDPHPERTPRPSPSLDFPLQSGRQPAPEGS